jgi:hypothetical protein
MQKLIDLIALRFPVDELTENGITVLDNAFTLQTMEDEPTIITQLHATASSLDIDIMEFTMHSKMIEDEDGNFITTLTFTFIDIKN